MTSGSILGGSLTSGYDGFARRNALAHSDGGSGSFQWDLLDRLTQVTWTGAAPISEALTYDLVGNATQVAREGGLAWNLAYDAIDQVLSSSGIENRSWTYDAIGNRTQDSVNGPGSFVSNFLTSNGVSTFTADPDGFGDVILEVNGGVTKNYVYRADGLLSGYRSGSTQVASYYDPLGRLAARAINDGTNTYTQSYAYIGTEPTMMQAKAGDGSITTYLSGQEPNDYLAESKNGVYKGYVTDHGGSILNSDLAGSMHRYGLHGEPTVSVSQSPTSSPAMFGWQGLRYNPESGQWDNLARQYNSSVGTFASQDPIGLVGGLNLYGSRSNNPLKFSDPTGFIHYNKKPPKTVPVTGGTKDKLQCVEACLALKQNNPDLDLRIGGGQEQSGHSKNSWHYSNRACDVSNPGYKENKDVNDADIFSCAESCGFQAGKYERFPKNPSNNHWHLQTQPGNRVPPINKGYEIDYDEDE